MEIAVTPFPNLNETRKNPQKNLGTLLKIDVNEDGHVRTNDNKNSVTSINDNENDNVDKKT